MFYVIQCRFSEFLVQLCIKNAFLWARAEILLLCAEELHFLGSVQKYYYPGTRGGWILVQGHFWGMCRYIHFWRNIHLWAAYLNIEEGIVSICPVLVQGPGSCVA